MTRTKRFLEMEADEQREFLARELADWMAAELWPSGLAEAFHRRAKILARSVGMMHAELLDVLRCDAYAIVAARIETEAAS